MRLFRVKINYGNGNFHMRMHQSLEGARRYLESQGFSPDPNERSASWERWERCHGSAAGVPLIYSASILATLAHD